ncbi:ATP-binding protein [Nostoc sp. TCL240-02]|nr:ATP-binding protein [Nostoc sp. TCL240-02]
MDSFYFLCERPLVPYMIYINELSSGEKEVLYGYLRLRNTAPRNSVLLMDEPELHLNPRLISGLASFYHKNLGKPLGNQL